MSLYFYYSILFSLCKQKCMMIQARILPGVVLMAVRMEKKKRSTAKIWANRQIVKKMFTIS